MGFNSFNKLKEMKDAVKDAGTEKTVQLLSDLNLVLAMLPDAGYDVAEVEVELGLAPRITIGLKVGGTVNEARLKSIQEKANNAMLSAIVSSLMQASKMQDAVNLETLVLKDVKVEMTASPTVSLQWKQKAGAKTAVA
jgi:hypothetical protein